MPASSKELLDIQASIECGFTLKCVRDMTRTYSQCRAYTPFEFHAFCIRVASVETSQVVSRFLHWLRVLRVWRLGWGGGVACNW